MLDTFISLSFAAILLTIGFVFINFLPFLKRLQLPVSIVAGLLGLLFAHISIGYFDLGVKDRGIFPEKYFLQMQQVPEIFINIVFAALMLGMPKLNIGKSIRLDEMFKEINEIIVEFGHREVFKKKRRKHCA